MNTLRHDIAVDLTAEKIDDFCQGFPSDDFYISRTAVEQAIRQHFPFNVIHPTSGLKIDFIVLTDSDQKTGRRRHLACNR